MNPILEKEMKITLRSNRTFYSFAAYLMSLSLLVIALWPKQGIYSFAEGASQSILTIVAIGQLLLIVLFVPAFTATAIVWEKENQSFDLLFFTLLKPRSIVVGKLGAALSGILLIVFSALPVTASCFFLGGVGLAEIFRVYVVLSATASFFALLSLAISSVSRSSYSATISSYITVLFFSVGTMVPYYVLSEWVEAKTILVKVRSLSPFSSMLSVVQPHIWLREGERMTSQPDWMTFLFLAGIGSVLSILFLSFAISRPASLRSRRRDVLISGSKETMKRNIRFPFYLIDPMKRKRQIGNFANCVFEKERRSRMFGNLTYIIRGIYACLIISLGLAILSCSHMGLRHLDFLAIIAMAFQLGIVVLIVPSLTAGSITQERESHNLEMLRMTPLRPWTIVTGKIMYSLLMLTFLLVACGPIWFMLGYIEALSANLVPAAIVLAATVLFSITCGTACSAFSRRTSSAMAVAYAAVILVSVVTLLPLFLGDLIHRSIRVFILSMNPFVASVQLVASDMFRDIPELWKPNLKFLLISSLLFLAAAIVGTGHLMKQEK